MSPTALKLAPLVFLLPGELRQAEWKELDMEGCLWSIPAERVKKKVALLVPPSTQAVELLGKIRPLTGRGRYVFPGARDRNRPMSENTVLTALRSMGFDKDTMTGHGFRVTARTILMKCWGFDPTSSGYSWHTGFGTRTAGRITGPRTWWSARG